MPKTLSRARFVVLAIAASGAAAVQAAPTSVALDHVTLDYDPTSFSVLTPSGSSVDSSAFSFTTSGTGIEVDFGGYLSAFADSQAVYGPDLQQSSYLGQLAFSAQAGYRITGYTLTYSGTYGTESPGSVTFGGLGLIADVSHTNDGSYMVALNEVGTVNGQNLPALSGHVEAWADVAQIDVVVGYQDVIVGYNPVETCPDPNDPYACTTEQVPIIEQQPIISQQMDYGGGNINLQTVRIEANVAAVPEPGALALMLLGLPAVALAGRVRSRATRPARGA